MCDPYIIRPGNVFRKGVIIKIIGSLKITKYNLARTKKRSAFQDCQKINTPCFNEIVRTSALVLDDNRIIWLKENLIYHLEHLDQC